MKKNILFLLLLLIGYLAQAQTSEELAENIYVKALEKAAIVAIKQKNIAIFNNMVKDSSSPTAKVKAWSYAKRAGILFEIHEKMLKDESIINSSKKEIVKEIMKNYQISIDSCEECSYNWRIYRLVFLQECNLETELQKKELVLLKAMGYKEEKEGISLGINAIKGNDFWLGAQISFLAVYSPNYKIKQKDTQTGKMEIVARDKTFFGASLLPISFNYNVNKKTTEFSVSLLQVNAPVMIDVTKIGYRNGVKGEQGSGFYRPEIGVGIGYFSLSYGYNVWFNKTYRATAERNSLTLRFTPIVKKDKR